MLKSLIAPKITRRMSYGKERQMAIGVLIKHVAKDGVNAKKLLPLIIELRALAVRPTGLHFGRNIFPPGSPGGMPGHQQRDIFRALAAMD